MTTRPFEIVKGTKVYYREIDQVCIGSSITGKAAYFATFLMIIPIFVSDYHFAAKVCIAVIMLLFGLFLTTAFWAGVKIHLINGDRVFLQFPFLVGAKIAADHFSTKAEQNRPASPFLVG